ncbi:Gsa protein [Rhodococcus sp. 06-412-2C]|uniref:glycosyltransferase n=1 Tax=unclassified Rhodococcus (in: high G+C Gram-positive bacteria) TaxID=192944 RepID=UPI000B9C5557|nr:MULTISPECIES: glycosyltransferase [unclassified Rhodococcus (in: high G+C Gram-positive bacteria)]OZC83652.1 Gsa protein [Rhodococcus sp. 06-412-2C]OZC93839.1 Gsa protein [Rhodococcus sp. 06-412-2B]
MPTESSRPPTLSVVTISFRDVEGLERTIRSVAEQSYEQIEHVVIDGGSGEHVEELLRRARPSYWQSRADGGRYDAMNQGIDRAHGDVVWLLHSGDCFADADSAASGMSVLATAGPIRQQWGYGRVRLTGDRAREGVVWGYSPFEMNKFALGIRPIPHQAALFGRDLIDRIGPYDRNFGLAADHLYMLRAAQLRSPVTIERVLCLFDAVGAGSVRPQREHFIDVRRAWDEADFYPFDHRRVASAYSRVVEWTARAKQALRGARP